MHRARHLCAQNADHLAHDSPFSALFTEVVCVLGTAPPQAAASEPQNGGNDAIQASNTPATRHQRASHGAKPPLPPNRCHLMACWARTHHSRQPRVTNVVKLEHFETPFNGPCYKRRQSEPKTNIFNEKGVGLTTFVTTTQESTQKTPQIDDVCNKTRRATNQRPSPTGVESNGGTGGPGCGARRRQDLAGLRDEAPSEARGADGSRAGRRPRRSPARHANGWGASRHPTRHQHQSTNRSQPALTPSPAPPRG